MIYKIVVERLKDDMYVDDLVSGTDGLGEAKVLYEKSRSIMSEAGFDLRKWETNSHELRAYISSQEGMQLFDSKIYCLNALLWNGQSGIC